MQGFAADLVLFDLNALSTLEDLPNEYKEDVPVRSAAPIRSAGERLRTSVGEWSVGLQRD